MHFVRHVVAAAAILLIPSMASAQVISDPPAWMERVDSHWLTSGFVGSSFGSDADEATLDFGGSVGYLWRGVLGAEFLAAFAPEFGLDASRSALLQGEEPWINTYMFNAVGAVPIGDEGRWQPYVSGGLGSLTLRGESFVLANEDVDPEGSQFGGNIGVGVLGLGRNNVGFRADLRYYSGFEDDEIDVGESTGEVIGSGVLSDLNFWRANVGFAYRW